MNNKVRHGEYKMPGYASWDCSRLRIVKISSENFCVFVWNETCKNVKCAIFWSQWMCLSFDSVCNVWLIGKLVHCIIHPQSHHVPHVSWQKQMKLGNLRGLVKPSLFQQLAGPWMMTIESNKWPQNWQCLITTCLDIDVGLGVQCWQECLLSRDVWWMWLETQIKSAFHFKKQWTKLAKWPQCY